MSNKEFLEKTIREIMNKYFIIDTLFRKIENNNTFKNSFRFVDNERVDRINNAINIEIVDLNNEIKELERSILNKMKVGD